MNEIKLSQEIADAVIEIFIEIWGDEENEPILDFSERINALVSEEGIRTMTPLENQWMDFKKILSELVVFQEDYEENTKDKCPGNQYYSDKLMAIVSNAKQAINSLVVEDEGWLCHECAKKLDYRVEEAEISLRMWLEFANYVEVLDEGCRCETFPDWLKERK